MKDVLRVGAAHLTNETEVRALEPEERLSAAVLIDLGLSTADFEGNGALPWARLLGDFKRSLSSVSRYLQDHGAPHLRAAVHHPTQG